MSREISIKVDLLSEGDLNSFLRRTPDLPPVKSVFFIVYVFVRFRKIDLAIFISESLIDEFGRMYYVFR